MTDIELLAVAGAAYEVTTGETFNFNADLIGVLDDGADKNDQPFLDTFPYVATPNAGQDYVQTTVPSGRTYLPIIRNFFKPNVF